MGNTQWKTFLIMDVLRGYAAVAADVVERFERVSSAALYKPVADLLPSLASTIADIGAGTAEDFTKRFSGRSSAGDRFTGSNRKKTTESPLWRRLGTIATKPNCAWKWPGK
jgi:hypothetical protein